ncbi:hypothetical protein AWENTII_010092 [Aspergillus wentii]
MDRPVGNTADVYAECEKWDAWFAQRGQTRTQAKRRYISTLIDTMHRYASQTPEARELVAELEFVWDQIKSNTSSLSSMSSPVHQSVGVPPLPRQSYASIGGRLARPEYEDMIATARGDSSLRVLSPVSQPDGICQRRGSGVVNSGDGVEDEVVEEELEDEDDEDEEYEEAQDTLYEDDEHNHESHISDDDDGALQRGRGRTPAGAKPPGDIDSRRWRRRVEQALTKMTAEVAAVREQMEVRALANRRRNSLFAWVKWLVWVTLRQIIWDIAMLGVLLIWMRLRGDRRLEQKLKVGWSGVKSRLTRLSFLRRFRRAPTLP